MLKLFHIHISRIEHMKYAAFFLMFSLVLFSLQFWQADARAALSEGDLNRIMRKTNEDLDEAGIKLTIKTLKALEKAALEDLVREKKDNPSNDEIEIKLQLFILTWATQQLNPELGILIPHFCADIEEAPKNPCDEKPLLRTKNGTLMPQLGFGTDFSMDLKTSVEKTGEEKKRVTKIFTDAIGEGYRLFDTAVTYGDHNGLMVDLLSDAITKSGVDRKDIFVVHKIMPNVGSTDFKTHVDTALSKLGNYLDVVMLHDLGDSVEEAKAALKLLQPYIESGRIGSVGVSNIQGEGEFEMFEKSLCVPEEGLPPISIVQNKFNPLYPDLVTKEAADKRKIAYMGYSIFGGGGGQCAQVDTSQVQFDVENYPELKEFADVKRVSPHLLVLAWALKKGTVQIPKTTKKESMKSNAKALQLAAQLQADDPAFQFIDRIVSIDVPKVSEIEAVRGDKTESLKVINKFKLGKPSKSRWDLLDDLAKDPVLKTFLEGLDKPATLTPPQLLVNNLLNFFGNAKKEGKYDEMKKRLKKVVNRRDMERVIVEGWIEDTCGACFNGAEYDLGKFYFALPIFTPARLPDYSLVEIFNAHVRPLLEMEPGKVSEKRVNDVLMAWVEGALEEAGTKNLFTDKHSHAGDLSDLIGMINGDYLSTHLPGSKITIDQKEKKLIFTK